MNPLSIAQGARRSGRRWRLITASDLRSEVRRTSVAEAAPGLMPLPGRMRRRVGGPFAILGCGLVSAGCLVTLWSGLIDRAQADPPPLAPASQSSRIVWVEINRPFALYDVSGGDYGKLPLAYRARRSESGSARQDVLTYGLAKPGETFLKLMISRDTAEATAGTSLFVNTARLAGEAGLAVVRSGLSSPLNTRFGSFEVSGVSISAGGSSAECLAFRSASTAKPSAIELSGLACPAADRVVDLPALACTLNRIDLVSAGDDVALQRIFVEAERRRGPGCGSSRNANAASSLSTASIHTTLKSLKGSIGATTAKAGP